MFDRNANPIPQACCEGILDMHLVDMVEERMEYIRRECGNIDVITENHCRTDLTSAIRIGELCDKYNVYAYEEAVTPLNPDMQLELRKKQKRLSHLVRESILAGVTWTSSRIIPCS